MLSGPQQQGLQVKFCYYVNLPGRVECKFYEVVLEKQEKKGIYYAVSTFFLMA